MRPAAAKPSDGVAWVTGASSGIGRAVALELARRGWTVAASARSVEPLEALSGEAAGLSGRIVSAPLDVTDGEAAMRCVAEIEGSHGPVALAVLNAGIWLPVDIEAFSPEPFEKTFAVNVMGVVNCLTPIIARMRGRGRGQISIVSSVAGYGGLPTSAAYGASKAALTNMAESLKFDLDRDGVNIGVVHPGFVDTPATQGNAFPMPFLMEPEEAARRLADGLGTGRFETTFPRRFTWGLRMLQALPYSAYFKLIDRQTGWSRRRQRES